jgi:hypothetical protein
MEHFTTSPRAVDKDDFAVFSKVESNQTGKEEWVSEAPQLVKKIHDDAKECLVLAMEMSYCSFRDAGRKMLPNSMDLVVSNIFIGTTNRNSPVRCKNNCDD